MAKLVIKNLSNRFGSVKCLDGVNLEVDDGELVAIVGPSGCGKTTLMRCITGLEKAYEGIILIDGEVINDKEPKDRDVAMVFQYYALYPHMTVRRNLSLGLEHTTNLSREEIQHRVEEIANILKISKLLEKKPDQLSGGEAQRVAIGRALVRKPKIFLLDEPLSAVDAKLRRELRTEIKKIQRRFNVSTIYVTHDQEEAMALGDKIVVLQDGKIQQVGTPDELYNRPKNQFVASFIGKPPMNFFEVTLRKRNDEYFLENEEFHYQISITYYKKHLLNFLDKNIIIGVRPSSIEIIDKKELTSKISNKSINEASVSLVENVGDENYIYATLVSSRIIIKTTPDINPEVGERIKFSFNEEDMHLFEKESKESLKK
jgi:multiple sugar transport system ATP-binding protein